MHATDNAIITLITRQHLQTSRSGTPNIHINNFEAWLDGELIVVSDQPRLDAARVLLKRGVAPYTLLTTRAYNRDYDSWAPRPISELAQETVTEGEVRGLQRKKWKSYPNGSSSEPVEPRTRKSPLRGVRVPQSKDDAVAPDRVTSGLAAA